MGIEVTKNNREQGVVRGQESQEADPMIGLERSTAEFGANAEKLDGLLKSEGGADGLTPEEQGKFSELKENLLSKFETLKGVLARVGPLAAVGALGAAGIVGLEELRGTFEISKELVAIGLADTIAVILFIARMKGEI